jgi:hypothetical protein
MSKRYRLSEDVRLRILNGIRAGGYAHVAAEAWGIPARVLDAWLLRGENQGAREPYRSFADEFRAALSQSRLQAEIQVYQASPRIWLQHGPGRETAARPGWSAAVQPAGGVCGDHNFLMNPQVSAFLEALQNGLENHPEALAMVDGIMIDADISKPPRQ